MRNQGSNPFVQGFLFLAIFVLLFIIVLYIPFLNIMALFFLPLPIIIYMFRSGMKAGMLFGCISFLVTLFLWPKVCMISFFAITVGLVMGYFYLQNKGAFLPLLAGMLTYLLNYLLLFLMSVYIFDINVVEVVKASMENMMQVNQEMSNFIQVPLDENQLSLYKEYMDTIGSIIPTVMIVSATLMAGLHHLVNRRVLTRMGYQIEQLPKFRTWTFPKSVLYYYLISLIILMLGIIDKDSFYYFTHLNLQAVLDWMIYLQGLAVIAYFSYVKKMGLILPVITVIMTFIIPPVGMLVGRLLGVLELGFRVRNRIKE